MHPLSTPAFERRVAEAVTGIERGTAAEVVLVVLPRAAPHTDVALLAGLGALVSVLTGLVFTEQAVGDYLLYAGPLAACFVTFAVVRFIPAAARALLGTHGRHRPTEILARATFQKAALHKTRDATAVLVFLALAERSCALIRDYGVLFAAGDAEWAQLETDFARALGDRKPDDAVLAVLARLGALLRDRLPPRPDDVDELPSRVAVTF